MGGCLQWSCRPRLSGLCLISALYVRLFLLHNTNNDELHSVASDFMQGALRKNVPLPAMEQFAELILAGYDPRCALEELAKFDPQTYGPVV